MPSSSSSSSSSSSISLVADRFLKDGEGGVFDLATAEQVLLVRQAVASVAWRDACQRALEVRRFGQSELIDYLDAGGTQGLEVYTWRGGTDPPRRAAIAMRVLPHPATAGICAALDDDRLGAMTRLYVRAPGGAGLTTWLRLLGREARQRGFIPVCPTAIARWPEVVPLLRNRSVVLLCDRLDERGRQLRVAGRDRGRVSAGTSPAGGGAALPSVAMGSVAHACLTLMRAHVRLCAMVCPAPPRLARPAFGLGPHPARMLAEAVDFELQARDATGEGGAAAIPIAPARLERIAHETDGLVGRFVIHLLAVACGAPLPRPAALARAGRRDDHSDRSRSDTGTGTSLPRVAEAATVYRFPSHGSALPSIFPEPDPQDMLIADAWNLHGRHASVVREADALITRGRWAAAIRTLRAGVAAHQRRGRPQSAAVAALALARLYLMRCEIAEADRWCREAGELAARAPDEILAADALHWAGLIALENADLESSDRWLRMALIAADQQGHRALQQHIEQSLARCLFWQGCVNQMSAVLAHSDEQGPAPVAASASAPAPAPAADHPLAPLLHVRALRLAARRHLVRGELADAGRELADAFERIEQMPPQELPDHERRDWISALHVDRARLQFAIGDREKGEAHLAAAAATRPTPARLARIRLLQIECDQSERTDDTRRRVSRLSRVFLQPRMPRLLRLRARYWIEPPSRRSAELARFIDRYGESALSGRLAPTHGSLAGTHFRALLHMSHELGDERAVLTRICGYVREQLAASYVAIHGGGAGGVASIAIGGCPRLASSGQTRLAAPALAERTIAAGAATAPKVAPDAIDAGAPVQANGETIGALISRWIIDRPVDRALTASILPAAADAAAPHVRAILDRGEPASTSASALASAADSRIGIGSSVTASMLGVSPRMVSLRETIARAADAPFAVLIEGESGSGKELVARALHQQSVRRIRRFCAVNCAALTDDLLEAELFGHTRGAFTGALTERVGLFEEAHEGTLFLDEVGELSARAQAKLLRAMQDGEIRRIGENLPRRVHPRIVAATNRTLREEAAAGRFRSDLLYRLDVVRIAVPPLRERIEDVPVLARAFWQQALSRTRSRATLDPETLAALARYDWPGNVRELQNVIARMAVQAPARGRVDPRALPPPIRPAAAGSPAAASGHASATVPLDRARRAFEEQFVRAALARAGGQLGRAARDLGVTRQGLNKLLARLGIVLTGESEGATPDGRAAEASATEESADVDSADVNGADVNSNVEIDPCETAIEVDTNSDSDSENDIDA